jgi:hypothetical protein
MKLTKPCRLSGQPFPNRHHGSRYVVGALVACPVCGEAVMLHECRTGYRVAWHRIASKSKDRAICRQYERAERALNT